MATHVAFLRGINVGGHRVRMPVLKASFEALGLAGVRTFIASGNVVFDGGRRAPAALERRIESQLAADLGYAVPTLLRTCGEVSELVATLPFSEAECAAAHSVHVIFFRDPLDAETAAAVQALETPRDRFRASGREVFWWCGGPMSETLVPARAFAQAFGKRVSTARNVSMLRRLIATF